MNRIYSEDIYNDDIPHEQAIAEMDRRTEEVLDSMDAVFNETRWEGDDMITEKEIMASSLSDEPIAKVMIVTKTPEVMYAIETLLEQEFKDI